MREAGQGHGATAPEVFGGRGTHRTVLLVALAALALVLLLAAHAHASHKQFRPGVMDASLRSPAELSQMGAMGIRAARLAFLWHEMEVRRPPGTGCSGGRYDFNGDPARGTTNYDRLVTQASANNVTLLPVLIGTPAYARRPDSSNMPHTKSKAIHDWKCFVRKVVGRYGRGGTFVQGNPAASPITEWQIWNEPNVRAFAARRDPNPREYARFLKFTRPHVLSQDPQATIVLAGMPEFLDKGIDLKAYLNRFYKVRRIKRQFDVLDIHPYARNARGVKGAMQRLRRQLRQLGDRRRYVWITEVGWATAGSPRSHFLIKTEKGQATQLRRTFKMLRANSRRFKLGSVLWFRWRDASRPRERNAPFDYAGLYRAGGQPKQSCRAYATFLGGSCLSLAGTATAGADGSSILDIGTAAAAPSPPPE